MPNMVEKKYNKNRFRNVRELVALLCRGGPGSKTAEKDARWHHRRKRQWRCRDKKKML